MSARKRCGLEDWEISLIKGMMVHKTFPCDQEILAHFSRPGRTVNNGRLSEIRAALRGEPMPPAARKYANQPVASREEIAQFLASKPPVDARTGLDLVQDELLIKAREAMLVAVQIYNNPLCYFKAELFIVSAAIAWTYLMIYYYRSKGIDCVYRDKAGNPIRTACDQPKYLDLRGLIAHRECPLSVAVKKNIEYILDRRDEIEHRGTQRIDWAISAKLQACALNFDSALRAFFGPRCGLGQELGLAIQFARLDALQWHELARAKDVPKLIGAFNLAFEKNLPEAILNDPAYAYRVTIVPRTVKGPTRADEVVQIVDPNSPDGQKSTAIVLKEREKRKYLAKQIVDKMKKEGFKRFRRYDFIQLWKAQNAKDPSKGYGTLIVNTWYWYDNWIDVVRRHCEDNGDKYR